MHARKNGASASPPSVCASFSEESGDRHHLNLGAYSVRSDQKVLHYAWHPQVRPWLHAPHEITRAAVISPVLTSWHPQVRPPGDPSSLISRHANRCFRPLLQEPCVAVAGKAGLYIYRL